MLVERNLGARLWAKYRLRSLSIEIEEEEMCISLKVHPRRRQLEQLVTRGRFQFV